MMMTDMARAVGEGVRKATGQAEDTQQPCIILPVPLFHVTASHHVFLASFASGNPLSLSLSFSLPLPPVCLPSTNHQTVPGVVV